MRQKGFKAKISSGAGVLPVFLVITAIMVELAIAGVAISNALNSTFFGERLGAEALYAARAGAQDAIIKVVRTCPLSSCPSSYSLTVGSRSTADVTISRDIPSGRITIDSVGTALTRKKKMEVILGIDQTTGQATIQSFQEVAL
jgi:hypothetical protein